MTGIRGAVGAMLVSALLLGTAGAASAQESLGQEFTYVITFDPGGDADSALVEIERTLPVVITHRFTSVLDGAVVRTEVAPEAMLMVEGVATVDRNVTVELPDPEQPDPEQPDPEQPDPEQPDPEQPDPEQPDPEQPDPEQPDPEQPDPEQPDPEQPDPEPAAPDVNGLPWGIDRVDQLSLPLSGTYDPPSSGEGVIAYVIDSGISPHEEFEDRLAPGLDLVGDGRGTADCSGHGTHVAGTLGGKSVGVASEVTLVPVRMLDCGGNGDLTALIVALDWIVANHPPGVPGVVNYSAAAAATDAEDLAIEGLLRRGLPLITAAGNDGEDACVATAGIGVVGALVVGGTNSNDSRASFSDMGPCLDLFAPGDNIRSASHFSRTETTVMRGNSMASPHVAGAAAVLLSLNSSLSPAQIETILLEESSPIVGDPGPGSPNRLLYIDPAGVAAVPSQVAAPPPGQVAVQGASTENLVRDAALAMTGGDPRALLALGMAFVLLGVAALVAGRRREERALLLSSRIRPSAPSALQLVPRARR